MKKLKNKLYDMGVMERDGGDRYDVVASSKKEAMQLFRGFIKKQYKYAARNRMISVDFDGPEKPTSTSKRKGVY